MKIVCDCGNEAEFIPDGEDPIFDEWKGEYTFLNSSIIDSWAQHDEAGFECKKCGKAIWWYA